METKPTTQEMQFTAEQVNLIKSLIAPGTSADELQLFLHQCKRTRLDPLTRQIYCIKRGGRMTIQTSIDGFRVIAERSGTYAGQDEPIWEDDEKGHPIKCTVKVYRFNNCDRYCAGVGVAHFKEYYPNPQNLQKTMPHAMIAKVAEALALRKAYPQDLSGLYTGDEMEQSEVTSAAPIAQPAQQKAPPVLKLEAPAKPASDIPSEIFENIAICEKVKDVDAYLEMIPVYKDRKEVKDAAEQRKVRIHKFVVSKDDGLPWLTDAEFKRAKSQIETGDLTVIETLKGKRRMKKVYKEALEEAMEFSLKVSR